MRYQHGATNKADTSALMSNRTDSRRPARPQEELANGFDDGWETWRNDNGTRNAGKADGNGLLAYLAFHGKEAFDGYKGPFRFAKNRVRVRGVDYKIPQYGVLAHFTFEGWKKLRLMSHAGGQWEDYHSGTRELNSERKRIGRMLNGVEELHPGWLQTLGYGLGMEDAARRNLWQLFGSALVLPGPADDESEAIANFIERHALRSVQRVRSEELRAASGMVDVWSARIEQLATAPKGYPDSLEVPVLARMLQVAKLHDGWEKEYENLHGLYSGLDSTGTVAGLDAISKSRRIMVLGDPGHGKSTLLAGAALRALEHGCAVIFARLEDLGVAAIASRRKPEWCLPSDRGMQWAAEMLLEAAIESGLPQLDKGQRDLAVNQIISDDDLLVVLDGWDEISSEENRRGAEDALKLLSARGSKEGRGGVMGSVVLASRVTGYRRPVPDLHEVLVAPLNPRSVRHFFDTWFQGEEGEEALARVRKSLKNPRLAELARIPVLAGFIAVVAEEEDPRVSKQGLYEQYLDRFLGRDWKDGSFIPRSYAEIQERLQVGTAVAWKMATWPSKDPYKVDQWEDHLTIKELGSLPPHRISDSVTQWFREVEDLALKDGLLVPHGRLVDSKNGRQRYRWLHRTIHEHLVGRQLAEIVRDDSTRGLSQLRRVLLRPTWEEALDHFVGFLEKEGLADLVIEDLWIYRDGRDIAQWITRRIATIAADTGAKSHRSDLMAELLECDEYMLAGNLEPSTTLFEIKKRLTDSVQGSVADDMALALRKLTGPEALEASRRLHRMAEGSHTAEQVLEGKMLELDPAETQRLAIETYSSGRTNWISAWTFPGASKEIVDLILTKILASENGVEWCDYIGALAARGLREGDVRIEGIDLESRELLANALPLGLNKDFLLAFFDHRIATPGWYDDWDWLPLDLRHELATRNDVTPFIAFIAGGGVPDHQTNEWVLTPWARVGYAVSAISSDKTSRMTGVSTSTPETVDAAIEAALNSPLAAAPKLVEEFHRAVKWALTNEHVPAISRALEVLNRNYKHHPRSMWCWNSYSEYASALARLPWPTQWEVWKREASHWPKLPNLDLGGWFSRMAPEERLDRLRIVTTWFAEDSPDGFTWFPLFHRDMSRDAKDANLAVMAQEVMSLVRSCRSKEKAMKLLEVSASWHREADSLEHFWPEIIALQDWLNGDQSPVSRRP